LIVTEAQPQRNGGPRNQTRPAPFSSSLRVPPSIEVADPLGAAHTPS